MSNLEKIVFTLIAPDGTEVEHVLPTCFSVCTRCNGHGKHVNPSIDGNGISAQEFAEDPDFAESYFAGEYDVPCEACSGLRVLPVVDEERCDAALLAAYRKHQKDEADYARESAAEMWACVERW